MTFYDSVFQTAKKTVDSFFLSLSSQQDIIYFSPTRWNSITNDQYQIISRLAKKRKILFIEEPVPFQPMDQGKARISIPLKNITVLQPKISVGNLTQDLPLLIAKQIRSKKMQEPVLWFTSTAFSEIIPFLNHSLIIYAFMNKQQFLHKYSAAETYLFSVADIVFTNEKMLYEEKKMRFHSLYYVQADKKLSDATFWDATILRMQRIMQDVSRSKKNARQRLVPSYYPLISQLTTRS